MIDSLRDTGYEHRSGLGEGTYHDVGENTSTRSNQTSHTRQEHIVQHETLGDESETRVGIQYRHQDGHIGATDCGRSRPTFSEG
jgi:hypothetical protein